MLAVTNGAMRISCQVEDHSICNHNNLRQLFLYYIFFCVCTAMYDPDYMHSTRIVTLCKHYIRVHAYAAYMACSKIIIRTLAHSNVIPFLYVG